MTTYRTRDGFYPADDPLAQQLQQKYRRAFDALPKDVQDRLREGHRDGYSTEQLLALSQAPHPLITLTYWMNSPESGSWLVSHEFVRWSRAQESVSETP